MSYTWTIGDTTFIGNADLSGDIEIIRPLANDHVLTIKLPAQHLAIFMRNRFVEAMNERFDLAPHGWELAETTDGPRAPPVNTGTVSTDES